MSEWIEIARVSDIPQGQAKSLQAGGKRLALSHVGSNFYCTEDLCTHDNGPLGEGELVDEMLECPRHGARFNVKTGQAVTLPAVLPIRTFPVKVTGERILVEI